MNAERKAYAIVMLTQNGCSFWRILALFQHWSCIRICHASTKRTLFSRVCSLHKCSQNMLLESWKLPCWKMNFWSEFLRLNERNTRNNHVSRTMFGEFEMFGCRFRGVFGVHEQWNKTNIVAIQLRLKGLCHGWRCIEVLNLVHNPDLQFAIQES